MCLTALMAALTKHVEDFHGAVSLRRAGWLPTGRALVVIVVILVPVSMQCTTMECFYDAPLQRTAAEY